MIAWEQRGTVGIAVIDRPEQRNALDAAGCNQLHDYLRNAPDLRAVVITGAGDKAFCAGADLARRAVDADSGLAHGGGDTFRPAFERMLDAVVDYPAPVIAAVNGAALGAGMQLAVACDLRVVAPRATFGIPSGRIGVILSAGNIARLAGLVGQATARDLLLTSRVIGIDEAEQVGLVQRRSDDALVGAVELAEEISTLAPLSVRGHKRALNLVAAAAVPSAEARREIGTLEAEAFESDDLREGLSAFAEKRSADFTGV